MNHVELDAPARPRSILVLEGGRLSGEQMAQLSAQLQEAFDDDKWPVMLNHDGPVYWVPVDDKLREFALWLVSMDDPSDESGMAARQTVTMTEVIDRAREALGLTE